MKEREPEPTLEEKVFEVLFEYPLWMAEQIVELNLFNDEINQQIKELHQSRIDFVKEIVERKNERESIQP